MEWIILDLKAFEWIQNGLYEELSKQGFSEPQPLEDPAGKLVMYTAADVAYGLLYDVKKQRFELRSTTLKDGEPGTWRSLSLWLFDENEGTRADAESILNDFIEVVQGPMLVLSPFSFTRTIESLPAGVYKYLSNAKPCK